ncbi:MAG TPA: sigma 54-interacting transcriptional regulator [Candidatus Binatia bacterium]|nr:sigma 54-interacting transcriptional regulator [Candidatus Binatia bacterium]
MIQRKKEDDLPAYLEDEPMLAAPRNISEMNRFDKALPAIAEHTVDALNGDFFSSLVRHLAVALEVRYAFATECVNEEKTRARSLAFWCDGKFERNFEYETAPTPCRNVLNGKICHYPEDVQARFPKDRELVTMKAESFLGAPVFDSSGKVIGHLAIIDDKFMDADPRATAILKIFAARAGAELERKRTDLKLRETLAELQQVKSRLQSENAYLQEEIRLEHNFEEVVGNSAALRGVLARVEQVAPLDSTVLIYGETGTGKELVARAIHQASPRKGCALVKLNCAAISAGLVESELFGHVKGAFTGALDRHVGRFELADHGTLFLDEVSELPLDTQVKLLRVLQEREFEPVGCNKSIRVDVRIIAVTNRRLEDALVQGRFRSDLFYRLNVFPIELPPLRERRSDISQLVMFFLGRFSSKFGKKIDSVQRETMDLLMEYAWPGNIRELQNVIERAVIMSKSPVLSLEPGLLPRTITLRPGIDSFQLSAASETRRNLDPVDESQSLAPPMPTLEELARKHVQDALKRSGGVIEGPQGAAKGLGLHPSTLRGRMAKLGIDRKRFKHT